MDNCKVYNVYDTNTNEYYGRFIGSKPEHAARKAVVTYQNRLTEQNIELPNDYFVSIKEEDNENSIDKLLITSMKL